MIILQIRHTTLVVIRVSRIRVPVALLFRAISPNFNVQKNPLSSIGKQKKHIRDCVFSLALAS